VADRLPRGQSILRPPSHCPECGHRLAAAELVPVLSYAVLRGRCRECQSRIPLRVPLVELTGGLLGAAAVWWFGTTLDALLAGVFFAFLLLVAVIDLEHKLVLNKVLIAGLPLALVSALLWSPIVRLPALAFEPWALALLVDSALGGLVGFAVFLLFMVLSRGGMGGGDVKLAGVLGVWLGLRVLPVALLLAVILGGLVALALLLSRSAGRKSEVPFAPFLCAGAAFGLLWGEAIGDWYLRLIAW
ncbi:MAG: prepilin peptidase, partial [Dehalococcoidia bacterium]